MTTTTITKHRKKIKLPTFTAKSAMTKEKFQFQKQHNKSRTIKNKQKREKRYLARTRLKASQIGQDQQEKQETMKFSKGKTHKRKGSTKTLYFIFWMLALCVS